MKYFAIPAAIGSITLSVPQIVRLMRQSHTEGVSAFTWGVGFLDATLWASYGIMKPVWPSFIANAPTAVGASLVLVMLVVRGRRDVVYTLVGTALAGFCGALFGLFVNVEVIGWLAVLLSFAFFIPQTLVALLNDDLRGVSITTWLITLGASTCWMLYGISIKNWPIASPNVIIIPLEASIVYRVWVTRKRNLIES